MRKKTQNHGLEKQLKKESLDISSVTKATKTSISWKDGKSFTFADTMES